MPACLGRCRAVPDPYPVTAILLIPALSGNLLPVLSCPDQETRAWKSGERQDGRVTQRRWGMA